MSWGRALLVALTVFACGRLNYAERDPDALADATTAPTAPTGDGGAEGGPAGVISSTKFSANDGYSYVDLAVDWNAQVAFASSRKSDECVLAVDFSNELAPISLGEVVPSLLSSSCLGVELVGTDALLVGSGSTVALVGRAPPFSIRDSVTVSGVRRFDAAPSAVFVAATRAVHRVTATDSTLVLDAASYASPCSVNDVAAVGNSLALACWEDNSPIGLLDATSLTQGSQFDMAYPDNLSGSWSAAASSDGSVVFVGGWVSAILRRAGSQYQIESRFDNEGTYRAATIADSSGQLRLYAVASTPTGSYLEEWDLANPGAPRLVTRSRLETLDREAYGISVDPVSRRAIVVSNGGDFVVVDLDSLAATATVWPAF